MTAALCYVEAPWAWFTTLPLDQQWGDDWDDAPYEHNAGEPYAWDARMPCERYELRKVAYEGPLLTPADRHLDNSPFSVQQINAGEAPWLVRERFTDPTLAGANPLNVSVWAGVNLAEFIHGVNAAGGTVYVPAEGQSPPQERPNEMLRKRY